MTKVPVLPHGIQTFEMNHTNISSFENLPSSLTTLRICCNKQLKVINQLPPNLTVLDLDYNSITTINCELPCKLEVLVARGNKLRDFPIIPESVTTVYMTCTIPSKENRSLELSKDEWNTYKKQQLSIKRSEMIREELMQKICNPQRKRKLLEHIHGPSWKKMKMSEEMFDELDI
jgi:Leucine-rich repeat (LRR) protein